MANGDTAALSNGAATWQYDIAGNASQVTVTISTDKGRVVYSGNAEAGSGVHSFDWDGKDQQGVPMPEGIYTITVAATNLSRQSIPATTAISGKVDGVEIKVSAVREVAFFAEGRIDVLSGPL